MATLPVLEEPHKLLRAKAKEIPASKIKSPAVQKLISDMSETLRSIPVGVGLAAPQVGKSLRIFIASEEASATAKKKTKVKKDWRHFIFINPKIIGTSKKKNLLTEGCLSVSDPAGHLIFGRVRRHEKLTLEAFDENGKKFTRHASGLFAQVIQHETDHLDGILFIDKAEEIHRIKNE